MGYIKQLEAVNHMLLMAGESTVSETQLTSDPDTDTEVALLLLGQFQDDSLMRGTVGNRRLRKFRLEAAGRIELENDIMAAELVSYHANDDDLMIQANVRGLFITDELPYLWNITDATETWKADKDYMVETIQSLTWENIDTSYQRAIMSAAARQYQIIMQGDADADAYLAQIEALYSAKAKGANIDDRRRHVFSQVGRKSYDAINRQGFSNDPSRFRYWNTNNG